ncbi:MAG TPA: DUF357 domain-containing protein [Halobacteria archaeon]|nr:DUF357 domain-containing protein [Halobacteria archaeon]
MRDKLIDKTHKYKKMLQDALDSIEVTPREDSYFMKISDDFLNMARSYYTDGVYFLDKEDYEDALASFSYGHAWLDAGMRLGIFKSSSTNHKLFSV